MGQPSIEDLSFDYQQVLPTPTPTPVMSPAATPTRNGPPVEGPTLSFPILGLLAGTLAAAALFLLMRR